MAAILKPGIEASLVQFLKSQVEIQTILGSGDACKLWPGFAPIGTTGTYVTYETLHDLKMTTLGVPNGASVAVVLIEACSEVYQSAKAAAEYIRLLLGLGLAYPTFGYHTDVVARQITLIDDPQAPKSAKAVGTFSIRQHYQLEYSSSTIPLPKARFTADKVSGRTPLVVQFSNLSDWGQRFDWDISGLAQTNVENPSYTFVNVGTYNITLVVTNEAGVDTEQKVNYITVLPYT